MNSKKSKTILSNEKGAISLFVVLAMMFFLVFMVGAYTTVARRNQQQAASMSDLQATYKADGEAQYDDLMGVEDLVVPITSAEDLFDIGSGKKKNIGSVDYVFSQDANYQLMNNIEIDMKTLQTYGTVGATYFFKDYVLYNSNYNVIKNGFDVFYVIKDEINGIKGKFKLIVFDGVGEADLITDNRTSSTETRFSIYNSVADYSSAPHRFLLYKEKKGASTFAPLVKDSTFFITDIASDVIPEMKDLASVRDLLEPSDKYFLFVEADKVYTSEGDLAVNEVSVGDYIDYKLSYQQHIDDSLGKEPLEYSWRVFSIENGKIQLISEGSPINYKYDGTPSNLINDLTTGFADETFTVYNNKLSVKGKYFLNAYAESVKNMEYSELSKFVTGSDAIDFIEESGGRNSTKLENGYASYPAGWQPYKTDMIDNDTSFWLPRDNETGPDEIYFVGGDMTGAPIQLGSTGNTKSVRPIVTLKADVRIAANSEGKIGDGTKDNPYNIMLPETSSLDPEIGDYVLYANKANDYTDGFNYRSIPVGTSYSRRETSSLDGWRILDIEENAAGEDVITLISAGIPLRYNFSTNANTDDIVKALTTNFENTEFDRIKPGTTSETEQVKGSEFLNSLYVESVTGFTYEMLSDLIYGNEDYISVSYNEGFDTSTTVDKNTLDESNNRFIINDWNDAKENLVDVGASYILGSKTADNKRIAVSYDSAKNHLTTSTTKTSIGVRVVVKIKSTSQIIGGSGTKADPYTLKSEGSSDVGLFKIGDYVTYRDIWNYENVNSRTRLDDTMFWDSVDLTGWRVVSYTNGELRLISAGMPCYLTANGNTNVTNSKKYAEYIKAFDYNSIDIYYRNSKFNDRYNIMTLDERVTKVECMDYNEYVNLNNVVANNYALNDLLYLDYNYWIGDYTQSGNNNNAKYELRYIDDYRCFQTSNRKKYGIRPIITVKTGFEVTGGSGTANNPYKIEWN